MERARDDVETKPNANRNAGRRKTGAARGLPGAAGRPHDVTSDPQSALKMRNVAETTETSNDAASKANKDRAHQHNTTIAPHTLNTQILVRAFAPGWH